MNKMIIKRIKTDTREEYLENLAKLYQAATGAKVIDFNSILFISELFSWVNERNKTKANYIEGLKAFNFDRFSSLSAELGLGSIDSIAKEVGADTIITPYTADIKGIKHIRKGNLEVVDVEDKRKVISELMELKNIGTFITQNPYLLSDFYKFEQLYNKYGYSILTGVYGNIGDKDKDEKILVLDTLKDVLGTSVKSEYFWKNDEYFYMIKANGRRK